VLQRFVLFSLAVAIAGFAGCGGNSTVRRDAGRSDAISIGADEDGDGISDAEEGRPSVDTDGDGTPDYLDDDSDADGVLDSIEGGGGALPVDSDADGTADFRDLDSDANGVPDMIETGSDPDGDSQPSSSDPDNDGDTLRDVDEIGDDPATPRDTDGDGTPDYFDLDSDDDNISDVHEGPTGRDTDRDGLVDSIDLDTDGDGINDADEAGDTDLATYPRDYDMDGAPDFRDLDSDADGLGDRDEIGAGTDPFNADTDGDMVTDLVEVASMTDPTDPTDSPRTRGDFVFLEPYMAPPDPPRDTLDFATDIRQADVYFLVDTTGSMSAAITSLRASIADFIPLVRAEIPDVYVGVGGFDDYPVIPYGFSGDRAYYNEQDLTDSVALAQAGANRLTTHNGYDGPESHVPALWSAITGTVLPGASGMTARPAPCAAGRFGYPCFRSGSVPIIVLVSDIWTHNGPGGSDAYSDASLGGHAPTYPEAVAALTGANARVIGIGQGTGGRTFLEQIARDTGAVDGAGTPLYTTWSTGTPIGTAVLNQIRTLANQTRFDISIVYQDDPADAVDTRAAFVDHIEANTAGDAGRGCAALPATDTDGDSFPDTFPGVTAGQRVCFDIVVRQNDTVMPTTTPQLFRATLRVMGDGFTELDSRDVYFLVPPRIEPPGGPG
jgi:hypothetical protein